MSILDNDVVQFNRLIACLLGFKRLSVAQIAKLHSLKAEYTGLHLGVSLEATGFASTQKQDVLEKVYSFIKQLRIKSHTKDDLLNILDCVTGILDDSIVIKSKV